MKRNEATGLLHAYLDGELDPVTSRELEAYIAVDPQTQATLERLRELSTGIRGSAEYHRAPPHLHERVSRSVHSQPPALALLSSAVSIGSKAWPLLAGCVILIVVLTWSATLWWVGPRADERLVEEVLASHVRSVMGNRLTDVASSDQHTVKPWLSSKLNYSPPVSDFASQGFDLIGARVDYLDGHPVAAMVYRRRQHVIDVYVWPSTAAIEQRVDTRRGFNLEHFDHAGMSFWIVSDLNQSELGALTRLLASN